MRILFYGLNYAPEVIGVGKYSGEMAEWLTGRGHVVRVVTAPPYYPQWRVQSPYKSYGYKREAINGVFIHRCPIFVPREPGGLKRILHLLSFGFSSGPIIYREARRFRPDVILTILPTLACAPFALVAAKVSGARTWLHIQDLEVDAGFSMGLLKSNLLRRSALRAERNLINRFDRVSTISVGMHQALMRKGLPENQLELFPNWVDTDAIYPLKNPGQERADFDLPSDAFVALYSGNMNRKQGLDILVDVARQMTGEPRFLLVLAGAGPMRRPLENMARGVDNIRFLPLQPFAKLNALLNCADIHLLPQVEGATDLVLPSKLTGMFASGRPVITVAKADSSLANEVRGRGLVIDKLDADLMSKSVKRLMNDEGSLHTLGNAARKRAISHWSRDRVLGEFEARLKIAAAVSEGGGR